MWHLTPDTWHLTHETWHVICDMWHVTCDTWRGVNFLSKFQLPRSFSLGWTVSWRFWTKGWFNEWMSDKGLWRTARASPGLLISIDNTMTMGHEPQIRDLVIFGFHKKTKKSRIKKMHFLRPWVLWFLQGDKKFV